VDRAFAIIFDTDLDCIWTLADQRGNIFKVRCNMHLHNPLIVQGCDEMRKLYALKEGSHQILFCYVGIAIFDVTMTLSENTVVDFFLEIESRSSLTYHALVHFTLTLTASQCTASNLVFFFYN